MLFEPFTSPWEPEEPRALGSCADCQGDFLDGDTVYVCDGRELCESCFEEWVQDRLLHDRESLAEDLGVEIRQISKEDLKPDWIGESVCT